MVLRRISAAVVCACLGACGVGPSEPDLAGFGPAEPRLGVELATIGFPITPAWSADSREVFFLRGASGGYALEAVAIESQELRRVAGPISGMNTGRNAIAVAAGAGMTYFAISRSNGPFADHLFRAPVSGGHPDPVLTDMAWPWVSVSADGRRVAYSRASADGTQAGVTVVVRDLETGTGHIARTGWAPLRAPSSLSPDGEWLVYTSTVDQMFPSVYLFSVASAESVEIWPGTSLREEAVAWSRDVLWEDDTPHLLFVRRGDGDGRFTLNRLDGRTGQVTVLGQVPDAEDLPYAVAWSADGRRAALWTPIETGPWSCSPDGLCIGRRVIHWKLYVWTEGQGWSVAADVALDEAARWLAFSPDGRTIGYQLYGTAYIERLD